MSEDKRAKILIVDDNKQNIELLMDLFKDEYRIAAAINGERGLKLATSSSPPDIILLDILMPDMDGYEMCSKLKEDARTKHIPVVFITAVSEVMDAARGFNLGAVDYITKPFHPPMVQARVKMHLDLKHKQELLEEYAFLDALTEIPNRRRFDAVMGKEWNRALRSQQPLALVLMDIDHFKAFNDTYGHGKGDDCLRQVAGAIQGSLKRAGDFVARYGGEEFAAILPYTEAEEAIPMASHIQESVAGLSIGHEASDTAKHVTLSLGVGSILPAETDDMASFIADVDKALYAAKEAGRNCMKMCGE